MIKSFNIDCFNVLGVVGERTPITRGEKWFFFVCFVLFSVFALLVIRGVSETSMILQVPMLLRDDLHKITGSQVEPSQTEARFVTESALPEDFCDPCAQEHLALWQLKRGL